MTDYISREGIMKEFADFVRASNNSDFEPTPNWNDAVSLVGSCPAADAVEVVRCKDCRYYEIAWLKKDGTDDRRYKPSLCVRGHFGKNRNKDWFCADGERREDE